MASFNEALLDRLTGEKKRDPAKLPTGTSMPEKPTKKKTVGSSSEKTLMVKSPAKPSVVTKAVGQVPAQQAAPPVTVTVSDMVRHIKAFPNAGAAPLGQEVRSGAPAYLEVLPAPQASTSQKKTETKRAKTIKIVNVGSSKKEKVDAAVANVGVLVKALSSPTEKDMPGTLETSVDMPS